MTTTTACAGWCRKHSRLAVEALRPFTRATIARLVGAVIADGSCDAVPALCDPFPIPVICALVGIEADRLDDMSRWASAILLSLRLDAGSFIDEIEQAQAELDDYLDELIADRRANLRDDLLSNLIAVEEEGDRLSPSELLSVVAMMLVAGTDTTRNQLSNMIHTFAEHPDQWALLRSRPELVAAAVEEAIRWEPATEALPRFATDDIEIGGHLVPGGTVVVLMSMSANHDSAVLPDAAGSTSLARCPMAGTCSPSAVASTTAWAPTLPGWSSRRRWPNCRRASRPWRWPAHRYCTRRAR